MERSKERETETEERIVEDGSAYRHRRRLISGAGNEALALEN